MGSATTAAVSVAMHSALEMARDEHGTAEHSGNTTSMQHPGGQQQPRVTWGTRLADDGGTIAERRRLEAAAAMLDRWEAEVDGRGRLYYFNRYRKQSLWQEEAEKLPPGSLVGRDDMTGQYLRQSQVMAYRKLRAIQESTVRKRLATDDAMRGPAMVMGTMATTPGEGRHMPFDLALPSTPPLSEYSGDDNDDEAEKEGDGRNGSTLNGVGADSDVDTDDERGEGEEEEEEEEEHAWRHHRSVTESDDAGMRAMQAHESDAVNARTTSGVAGAAAAAIAVRTERQAADGAQYGGADDNDGDTDPTPGVWVTTYDSRGFKFFFDLTTNTATWDAPHGKSTEVHELRPPPDEPPLVTVQEADANARAVTVVDTAPISPPGAASPGKIARTAHGVHGDAPPSSSASNLRLWKINNSLASSGLLGVPYKCTGKWKAILDRVMADSRDASFEAYAMRHFVLKCGSKQSAVDVRDRLVRHASVSITTGLTLLRGPRLNNEAVRIFGLILEFMNGWQQPGRRPSAGDRRPSTLPTTRDIDLAKEILSTCVVHGPKIVDETYCQLVKQTTQSAHARSCLRVWQLLYCFCVTVIPSSRDLVSAVLNSMQRATHDMRVPKPCRLAAETCHLRLVNTIMYGTRGYLPSNAEISSALTVPSNTACFSCTLDEIMYTQHQTKPCLGLSYPEGLHAIVTAFDEGSPGVYDTPSLFHQSANPAALGAVIEDFCAGHYASITSVSPHVLAGLMKTYLKEMALPIIPSRVYSSLMDAASDSKRIAHIIEVLPEVNRLCLAAVIRILSKVCGPQHVHRTGVSTEMAAAIVAPCVMHAPSTNSKKHRESQVKLEEALMKRLINSLIKFLYNNERNPIAMALMGIAFESHDTASHDAAGGLDDAAGGLDDAAGGLDDAAGGLDDAAGGLDEAATPPAVTAEIAHT